MEEEIKNNVQQDNIDKITTIKLSKEVRDKLAEIGNKDETFDDVIRRLIRRSESERSGEIVTGKASMIQYKRKKEFIELYANIRNLGTIYSERAGFEYEYNIPPKKEGEWELDIKIMKIYYKQKAYNPSEFFGVDNENRNLSTEFVRVYFNILSEIFIKDFGITKLKTFSDNSKLSILEWRKIYYENKISEESFINDIEDVLRKFSDRKEDAKVKDQLKNSVVGY